MRTATSRTATTLKLWLVYLAGARRESPKARCHGFAIILFTLKKGCQQASRNKEVETIGYTSINGEVHPSRGYILLSTLARPMRLLNRH